MDVNNHYTNKELKQLATQQNKSIDEVRNDLRHALKDLQYSNEKLANIITNFNYIKFPNKLNIHGYGKHEELNSKYMCYDNIDAIKDFDVSDLAVVTGFGPTNSPTAGTLSSIFKALEFQSKTGIYTHIIISELSALNSRKKPLDMLIRNSYQFVNFIYKLGFDKTNGEIRTHNYHDHSRVFALVASTLSVNDLVENLEVTNDTYKRLNLLGNDFSKMVSRSFTMSDIILPIVRDGKKGVIVTVGLEEHHHPYLARTVLERLKKKDGGISTLIDPDATIGALYGKLISGMFPYVKMSKSIPESSINLGDSVEDIKRKIIDCGKRNEHVVLQMMILASNWDAEKLRSAQEAHSNLESDYNSWLEIKKDYFNFFLQIKSFWEESKYEKDINIRDELFKC